MTQSGTCDICMFVHNDVVTDGRVLKEATSLASHGWKVVIIGISLDGPPPDAIQERDGFTIRRVIPRLLRKHSSGTFGKLLRLIVSVPEIIHQIRRTNARIYHAHDFTGLLIMALAGIRAPIVYDSHELFFDRFPTDRPYPLKYLIYCFRPLEKWLARRAVAMLTPSDEFADTLASTLGVPRPIVLRASVDLRSLQPGVPIPRQAGQMLIGHSGYLIQGRHLRELMTALTYLPDHIALALIGDGYIREELLALAESLGLGKRVLSIRPVTPYTIPNTLAQVDVAAVLMTPSRRGYDQTLPNKLFEAVAAGVPIVASKTTAIERWMSEYAAGLMCDPTDPRSIAETILAALEPQTHHHLAENAAKARLELNWEVEETRLTGLYERLLKPES